MADRRPPASGAPGLLQAFVNTRNRLAGTEALPASADAARWLAARSLLAGDVELGDREHARVLELREALRALMRANNGVELDAAAVEVVNAAGRDAGLRPRLDERARPVLEPTADGVAAALGALVALVHATMLDATFPRLKACRADDCQWVFYDRSPNASSAWCERSSASCGSRHKMREYRRRSRGGA